jgi:subtilase family serine protease
MKNKISANIARQRLPRAIISAACAVVFLFSIASGGAADALVLHSRVHAAVMNLTPVGRLPAAQHLNLVLGVQLTNQAGLNLLLQELYDPASTNFHRYLTPAQFTAKFGPTDADYQAVLNFAKNNGLQVVKTYDNRRMVDVSATVSDIEKAFHVTLRTYYDPVERRQFYAPDVEASVDASVPILDVSGLDNYVVPHPMLHKKPATGSGGTAGGTGPSGNYRGYDFRTAYAPNVSLTGAGQYVGLVEKEGYYASDITTYEDQATPSLPHVSLQNVLLDGFSGTPDHTDTNGVAECSLDIEMAISMAPGLNAVYVFEGSSSDHLLGSMVTYNGISQFSTSWGMGQDGTAESLLQQMQAQGQSFFSASGDGDAYVFFPIPWPSDDPNLVTVGGTTLSMNGSGASYNSDTVWNSGFFGVNDHWFANGQSGYWGSGGGVSTSYSIPIWQQSVNMSGNGGSTAWRNVPDVALTANDVWVNYDNGLSGSFVGTSCASPLWAGFTALVNEQAANQGLPSVGFLIPAFYAIGQSPLYNSAFHDVTTGNNFWPDSTSEYSATTGYDLCTGWGTPNGQGMIDALVGYAGPIWVNFYDSCPGVGSYTSPYCALDTGIGAVSSGGTLCIMGASSTTETRTISSPMTIRAFFGPVTIGH